MRLILLVAAAMLAGACTPSSTPPDRRTAGPGSPPTDVTAAGKAPAIPSAPAAGSAGTPAPKGTKPWSAIPGFMPGGECPDPGPARAADIAAMATARIPLKVGLTMAHNWKANAADYEHECLVQVVGIDARGLVTTTSCPIGPTREIKVRSRRICWTDMFDSYLYLTENDDNLPETFVGTLLLNLSTASFAALKSKGETRHRFLSLYDPDFHFVQTDVEGVLKSDGPSTFSIIMNDRLVEVPIVEHHVDEGLVPDGQ